MPRSDETLAFDRICQRYGDLVALDDMSFDIRAGEIFGFVGSNGAGRTTTMRIALGVLSADSGEVRWAGQPVTFETRRRIGYMPEERVRTALTSGAGQSVLDQQIASLGGNPADVASGVAQAGVQVSALNPPRTYDPQRLAVGSVAGILVYLALIGTGQSVAMGVVEEKSSRVVELLWRRFGRDS